MLGFEIRSRVDQSSTALKIQFVFLPFISSTLNEGEPSTANDIIFKIRLLNLQLQVEHLNRLPPRDALHLLLSEPRLLSINAIKPLASELESLVWVIDRKHDPVDANLRGDVLEDVGVEISYRAEASKKRRQGNGERGNGEREGERKTNRKW